jgi:hypothetical protein
MVLRNIKAGIVGKELYLTYEHDNSSSSDVGNEIASDLAAIAENLGSVTKDLAYYNRSLAAEVRNQVSVRKQELFKQLSVVESLNIPIRRREGESQTYALPTVKRKPQIERPKASTTPYKPEPALPLAEYDHILEIVQNMAMMLERSPSTFAKLDEEEIRDHFLVQLNGAYEGKASGETFNQYGKTDILIRDNGQNVFIAECKFWGGAKAFKETIDQLLGYTSWRDTKTAIFRN